MDTGKSTPLFSISTVKAHCGLTGRQIRYYESKGIIQPKRTAGNQRIFSLYDLEILQKMLDYLAQGMNLDTIAGKLRDEEQQYYSQNPDLSQEQPCGTEKPLALNSLYPVTDTGSLFKLIIQKRKG